MNLISALLEQRTGQQIAANRAWRIETALKPLLREKGLASLDQLVAQLVATRTGDLGDQVVDALLNQETSFFRDAAVLDMLVDATRALQAETPERKVRIWSSGCSTGQEPLSLAMLFDEGGMGEGLAAPEIVATDVSPAALTRARAGRYSQFEIQRGLPVRRMMTWFDGAGGDWAAKPELLRRIQFRQQNLTADAPPPGKFDVVLCRNVLLYFSQDVRRQVFGILASALRPGGLLVLGAGETVIGLTDQFKPCDRFRGFYRAIETSPARRSAFG
ncbi:chemotaxis protein methyltransferase CheR [Sphingomonas naasensis]|uniref:Protein-glutamate O-methyltransferase CheR n=1 Tax=Sphingomonas naasensis TaxID=1344951 RepID=A0A4V3QX02_9SPHN|nr:protein-glutamate O-methyltransferase CheR [Sphingomonas naasensis]NIJ20451.1 chemotaxis protein methyltransferase CheR [Sphingomonas naasensis]TGX44552.1 protein-glutamate O-methyltransferase CheR [Sphingomonas naasensis]